MRSPTSRLIVDTNILVRAVISRHARIELKETFFAARLLHTSERAIEEMVGVMKGLAATTEYHWAIAAELTRLMEIVPAAKYADDEPAAALALKLAPQSGNGSTDDAHILASAWAMSADIWSHDRDFAGTGWPAWSSANLKAVFALEDAADATAP